MINATIEDIGQHIISITLTDDNTNQLSNTYTLKVIVYPDKDYSIKPSFENDNLKSHIT